jgi:ABC-type transporter Mla maintaining outer membrane lipid asymmetry permease subunit MlaE
MEASAVDPYKYLAATRVLACILMLPLLTELSHLEGFPSAKPLRFSEGTS